MRSATASPRCCAAVQAMSTSSRRSLPRRRSCGAHVSLTPPMTDYGMPYIGRSLLRREDRRLLTGQGQFIADLELPRMLHAAFVRSPVAHARIRSVDLSRAVASGVALALSGADLARLLP